MKSTHPLNCPYHSEDREIEVQQTPEAAAAEARWHRARIYVADNDVEGIACLLEELAAFRAGAHPTQTK